MLSRTVSVPRRTDDCSSPASRSRFSRLLVLVGFSLAQSTAGRSSGHLDRPKRSCGRAGPSVTVTDVQRGTSRTVTTDESGSYAVPDLQPGTYKIHVKPKASRRWSAPTCRSKLPATCAPTSPCSPDNITETVTITEEVPLVNTTSATLGGTLSNKEINDLPLNGRNYENLLQLRPGVMRYPGGGFSTTSSNGLRAEDNAYFIEGLFNSEPFSGQALSMAPASPETRPPFFPSTRFRNSMCSRILRLNMDGSRAPS